MKNYVLSFVKTVFSVYSTLSSLVVNYAVSERGDRVTGTTTLTRMAGYNGMNWAETVLC